MSAVKSSGKKRRSSQGGASVGVAKGGGGTAKDWCWCQAQRGYYHRQDQAAHHKWLQEDEAGLAPATDPQHLWLTTYAMGPDVGVDGSPFTLRTPLQPLTRAQLGQRFPSSSSLLWPAFERSLFFPQSLLALIGQIGFGDHVLVQPVNATLKEPARVWQVFPGMSEEPSLQALPEAMDTLFGLEREHDEPCLVSLVRFDAAHLARPASRVEFQLIRNQDQDGDDELDRDEMLRVLTDTCRHLILCARNTVNVSFYGRRLTFEAVAVEGNVGKEEGKERELEALHQRLGDMSLQASSTPKSTTKRASTEQYFVILPHHTDVGLRKNVSEHSAEMPSSAPAVMPGGLSDEVRLMEKCWSHIIHGGQRQRSSATHGILLWGPSGTGKTMLGKSLAVMLGLNLVFLPASELFSKFYGETEKNLKVKFAEAEEKQPSLLFIDDLDVLCPQREGGSRTDQEKRVLVSLANLLDKLGEERPRVAVLATTNQPWAVDPSLRRFGRLDKEIEVGVPTPLQRGEILRVLLSEVSHSLSEANLDNVARSTHGFVGADLQALVGEAETQAESKSTVSMDHFRCAVKLVKPSAMREVQIEVPNVTWKDIGGLDDLKLALRQAVEWPLQSPEAFRRFGVSPPKGLLMYGPPGCSKTMVAKALANETGQNFLAIKGPELFSKYVGESERAVRELFRKAKRVAPAIVFFDEIDALGSERGKGGSSSSRVGDHVLAQLLTEMDGIEQLNDVTIVAATNRPDMIDEALMRPGRLDRLFYVPLPDEATRRQVFAVHTKNKPLSDDVNFDALVARTEGYSGAEVAAVCTEAAMKAMEEDFEAEQIDRRHFEDALSVVTPRVTKELLHVYDKFRRKQ